MMPTNEPSANGALTREEREAMLRERSPFRQAADALRGEPTWLPCVEIIATLNAADATLAAALARAERAEADAAWLAEALGPFSGMMTMPRHLWSGRLTTFAVERVDQALAAHDTAAQGAQEAPER